MKIELTDRAYWLQKCEDGIKNILYERMYADAEFENRIRNKRIKAKKGWFGSSIDIESPITERDVRFLNFYYPSGYGAYGLKAIKSLVSMLNSEHTGVIEVDADEWSWIK